LTNFQLSKQPDASNVNSSSSKINNLSDDTYKKRGGTTDSGKEYESVMCTFYALRLCNDPKINDFKMTTNCEIYGDFDDISLEITYKDQTTRKLLLQLKHKDNKKNITKTHFIGRNNDFSLLKYVESFEHLQNVDDVICILYTNCSSKLGDETFTIPLKGEEEKGLEIKIKQTKATDIEDVLTDDYPSKHLQSSSFQFEITSATATPFKRIKQFLEQFYFLPGQVNLKSAKERIRTMLKELLETDISDSLFSFMKEWWHGNFVLTKQDIILKLTELALSSWIETLSDTKCNEKTDHIKEAIMNFDMTIVQQDKKKKKLIVNDIWEEVTEESKTVSKIMMKYELRKLEKLKGRSIMLWYLGLRPLIVRVNKKNKKYIKCALKLFNNVTKRQKIVLFGNVKKEEFPEFETFSNLYDLSKKQGNEENYNFVINNFEVGIKGRRPIRLKQFIETEPAESISTSDLLKMTQSDVIEKEPTCYIPRRLSRVLLNTRITLEKSNGVVIVNCDEQFASKEETSGAVKLPIFLEMEKRSERMKKTVLLCVNNKCTIRQFEEVCEKSSGLGVHLLQVVNENSSVLLLSKGDKLEETECGRESIEENDILKYFDYSLNVCVAPPGMGKSMLFKHLSKSCQPKTFSLYVKLLDHDSFLNSKRTNDEILSHFLEFQEGNEENPLYGNEEEILRTKKIVIFLDGLDEVGTEHVELLVQFAKHASSEGVTVWISSRQHLRRTICDKLHTIPITIQDLTRKQQENYIRKRLRCVHEEAEIELITNAIFASTEATGSQEVLGVPLQLDTITKKFLHDAELYSSLKHKNILSLTTLCKLFFDGRKIFRQEKTETKVKITDNIFKQQLKKYEVPGLKASLHPDDFKKLKVNDEEMKGFVDDVKKHGDELGLVKEIDEDGRVVFVHESFGKFFACTYFKNNFKTVRLLKEELFTIRYDNLRLTFDMLLGEDCPLHLAVINNNEEQVKKHINEWLKKDEGGRNAFHLVCSYGSKYWKSKAYQEIMKIFLGKVVYVFQLDDLHNFDCVDYSLISRCLYPIEKMIQKNILRCNNLTRLFKYYNNKNDLVHNAKLLGCHSLLSAVEHLDRNILKVNAMTLGSETALMYACKEGQIANVKKLIDQGANVNVVDNQGMNALHYASWCLSVNTEIMDLLISKGVDVSAKTLDGKTALLYACKESQIKNVKRLIDRRANVNVADNNGMNALHYASWSVNVNTDIIDLLIRNGVKVNAKSLDGKTALLYACKESQIKNVRKLIARGADINVVDNQEMNALHYASWSVKVNTEVIDLLISEGVDVNAQTLDGKTALLYACKESQIKNVKRLIDCRANVNLADNNGMNALHYASWSVNVNTEVIDLLIRNGVKVNAETAEGKTALLYACKENQIANVRKLIKNGADVNMVDDQRMNALHYACWSVNVNTEIIDLLIRSGVKVNAETTEGTTALLYACKENQIANVSKLIENGADVKTVDDQRMNSLHYACSSLNVNTEVIGLLISYGVDVNAKTREGKTALLYACKENQIANVKKLIENGADVKMVDDQRMNALHYACKSLNVNTEVIDLLISYAVDVNAKSQDEQTALLYACKESQIKNVRKLIERGADINAVDNQEMNALHYACWSVNVNTEIIDLLIGKGVDVNAKTLDGKTALLYACKEGYIENVNALLERGADVNMVDNHEKSVLHYVSLCRNRNAEMMDLLMNYGFDGN
jgi:ankyrin repeat protein